MRLNISIAQRPTDGSRQVKGASRAHTHPATGTFTCGSNGNVGNWYAGEFLGKYPQLLPNRHRLMHRASHIFADGCTDIVGRLLCWRCSLSFLVFREEYLWPLCAILLIVLDIFSVLLRRISAPYSGVKFQAFTVKRKTLVASLHSPLSLLWKHKRIDIVLIRDVHFVSRNIALWMAWMLGARSMDIQYMYTLTHQYHVTLWYFNGVEFQYTKAKNGYVSPFRQICAINYRLNECGLRGDGGGGNSNDSYYFMKMELCEREFTISAWKHPPKIFEVFGATLVGMFEYIVVRGCAQYQFKRNWGHNLTNTSQTAAN